MLLAWAVIALLILLTGLYVAAEFAAVSARRSRLRRLAEDGNVLAARLLPVLEDPASARSLHRRVAGRHHAVQPDPRRLRPGDARAAVDAAPGSASKDCNRRRSSRRPPASSSMFLTTLAVILGELVPEVAGPAEPDPDGALHRAAHAVVACARSRGRSPFSTAAGCSSCARFAFPRPAIVTCTRRKRSRC